MITDFIIIITIFNIFFFNALCWGKSQLFWANIKGKKILLDDEFNAGIYFIPRRPRLPRQVPLLSGGSLFFFKAMLFTGWSINLQTQHALLLSRYLKPTNSQMKLSSHVQGWRTIIYSRTSVKTSGTSEREVKSVMAVETEQAGVKNDTKFWTKRYA